MEDPLKYAAENWIKYVAAFIVMILLLSSFTIIGAGESGVIFNRLEGVKQVYLGEGINFKMPIIEKVIKFDVRTQKDEVDASSASKDLQIVKTTIAVNYNLREDMVPFVYQKVGEHYKERIIAPAIQESVKAATASFTAEELITKRSNVKDVMLTELKTRLNEWGIDVKELSIVNFDFSEEFNKAIESKVTSKELALKAENDLKRVQFEAEQKIVRAKAEAEALKAQKTEITDQLIELRKIEVMSKELDVRQEAVNKWDGVLPKFTGGGAIPFIQITEE